MKKCIAYFPLGIGRQAWVPCARQAEEQSLYCRKHGDAIAGAVLGLCVRGSCNANSERTNERGTRKKAAGSAYLQERHD